MEKIELLSEAKKAPFFSNAPFHRSNNRAIGALVKDGLLSVESIGDLKKYTLTEQGDQYLSVSSVEAENTVSSYDVADYNNGKRGASLLAAMLRSGCVALVTTETGLKHGVKLASGQSKPYVVTAPK